MAVQLLKGCTDTPVMYGEVSRLETQPNPVVSARDGDWITAFVSAREARRCSEHSVAPYSAHLLQDCNVAFSLRLRTLVTHRLPHLLCI